MLARVRYVLLLLLGISLLGGYLCALAQDQRPPFPPKATVPPPDNSQGSQPLPIRSATGTPGLPKPSTRHDVPNQLQLLQYLKKGSGFSTVEPPVMEAPGPGRLVLPVPPAPVQKKGPALSDAPEPIPVPAPPTQAGPEVPVPSVPDVQTPGLFPEQRAPSFKLFRDHQRPFEPQNRVADSTSMRPTFPAKSPETPVGGTLTPVLALEKKGPTKVRMGQNVPYEIILRNIGTVAAQKVTLEDELPPGAHLLRGEPPPILQGDRLTWWLDNVPPGSERRFHIELQATTSGEWTGNATVTVGASSAMRTRVDEMPLSVSVTGPTGVRIGQQAVFDVKITNTAKYKVSGLLLFSRLPSGLKHPMGSQIEADVGELPSLATKNFQLTTTAHEAGRQVAQVKIIMENGQEAIAEGAVVVSEAGILLRALGVGQFVLRRDNEARIEVTNLLDQPLRNLSVVQTLPDGLEYQTASDRGIHRAETRSVHWLVDALPPGKTKILGVKVRPKTPGHFPLEVQARSEDGKITAKTAGTVAVEGLPELVLKVADRDVTLEVGKETVYEFRVHNQGNMAATGVQVLVTLPDGLRLTRVNGPASYRVQHQQVLFNPLPKLNPQKQEVFQVRVVALTPGERRVRVQATSDQVRVPIAREERTLVYDGR